MDLNVSWYNVHQIFFQNATPRTINGINGIDMRRSGAKIENESTGTHTFNAPIAYHTTVELNPVAGNLIFNSLTWRFRIPGFHSLKGMQARDLMIRS